MLRKLIKYDIKSNIKIIAGTYSFITLFSILHLIMYKLSAAYPLAVQWGLLEKFTFIFHILGIGVGFGITLVACVLYFRKNMFKDEGYLTHTLPASEGTIFTSKYLSTVILFLINIAGAYITIAISTGKVFWCGTILREIAESMKESGFNTMNIWLVTASMIVGGLFAIIQMFGAITIGYSVAKKMNKDIMSFIVYFAGYIIMQGISIGIIAVCAVRRGMVTQILNNEASDISALSVYMSDVLCGSLVLMIVMAVFCYFISVHLLNKKLNLD